MRLEQVSSMLREFGFDIDDKERLALARRICDAPEPGRSQNGETPGREKKSYQVVLALLLMCKQHCLIRDFLDHGIDDGCLPLLQQRTGTAQFSLESHRNPGRKLAIFDGWPEDALDHFYRYQWQLIPTFFSKMDRKERKVPHYELRLNHILPYVHNPSKTRSLDGSDGEDRRGHFGQVSVYDLHPSQQLLHRYTVDGLNGLIAVKKLNSRNPQDFFNESDVLMRLSTTQKPTPHLARLLATYQQPSGPDIESMEFFLMFECAESNLERFWKRTPASLEEEFPALKGGYIARWVAMQCKGLADALATLHSLPKSQEQSDNNIPTRGLHGDIKPANILRYINWKDPANPKQPLSAPLGVLQLTDFGLSSIHHTDTVADVKMKVGASPYKPPETHLVMPISQSLDIWTLGCLYLDFLTWLVMGQEGQEKFVDKRRKHRGLSNDSHPCFFEVFEDKQGWTHVSISRAVLKWAQRLSKSKNTSQFVCDFVRFIVSEMLVIEDKMNLSDPPDPGQPAQASEEAPPSTRIEAAGLATILKGFIRDDMSYYTSVAKRPDLSTFNTPACVIKMKKTMQQATIEAEERHRRLRTHLQQVESQSSSHPDLPHAWSRHATERTDSTSSTL
ncbi:kinase-like protein [Thozetella sp. PMI_491]|nr:kinase-like protein [Thozetella sp. PMI_491]